MTARLEQPVFPLRRPKILAAIPACNEEATIAKTIINVRKFADKVIVCDDGSNDSTAEIAESLGAEVIRHERNLGYGSALATLFEQARIEQPDIFITMDGDGQHDPKDIPSLVEVVLHGEADIVIGSRFLNGSGRTPAYRRLGIKVINGSTNIITGQSIRDTQSGFRAYNKRAFALMNPSEMGMGASVELLVKAKEKKLLVAEVPINISYESRATRNPLYHGIDVLLTLVKHMSIRHPLLFYGVPGFVLFLLGLGFGLWAIEIFAVTNTLVTNVTLLAIASFTIGTLLMSTSIILWVMVTVIKSKK